MARAIKDDIVTERIWQLHRDDLLEDESLRYSGVVKTTLDKTTINEVGSVLPEDLTVEAKLTSMNKFCKNNTPAKLVLEFGDSSREQQVPKSVIDALKAIAVCQVNPNPDYSRVLADVWVQVFKSYIRCSDNVMIARDARYSRMQNVTLDGAVEFLKKQLDKEVVVYDM